MAAQAEASDLTGILMGICNPLLDISAEVPPAILDKYGVKPNDAVLAEEKHIPVYKDIVDNFSVQYIAGGAGQNSIRVAQWMLKVPFATSYFGCVGSDAYASQMKEKATADGVNVQYQVSEEHPTGTCAVLVTPEGERSLIANLAAANHFTPEHLSKPESVAAYEKAQYMYITGFFLTVSLESIEILGKHAVEQNKVVCMNLSAPFLIQFFYDQLMTAMPYTDIMFGNESEAATFGEKMGWGSDLQTIALKLSALPKASGLRGRTVVFTQGKDATIVATNGKVQVFDVVPLPKEELVDTNGAGDAFVGGFLSQLVKGAELAQCVDAGHWAARVIIQRSGCSYPAECTYGA